MSIEQHPYFKIICDECGEAFPEHESGGGYTLYDTEAEARIEVDYHDGEITLDGKIYCHSCTYEKTNKSNNA